MDNFVLQFAKWRRIFFYFGMPHNEPKNSKGTQAEIIVTSTMLYAVDCSKDLQSMYLIKTMIFLLPYFFKSVNYIRSSVVAQR